MSKDIFKTKAGKEALKIILKRRRDAYNAMSLEDKIDLEELTLRLRLRHKLSTVEDSLRRLIELMSEKIKIDHCE